MNGSGQLATINGPWADDTSRYSYEWKGRRSKTEILADDGVTVTRSEEAWLDSLGRVAQLTNSLGTFANTYTNGNLTTLPDQADLPGGFNTIYSLYAANAGANALGLQTIHHRQGSNTVQKHDYTYDLMGNLATWNRTNAAANVSSWTLRHDQADQLNELEENLDGVPQKKEAWHYDPSGNITSVVSLPPSAVGTIQTRSIAGRNQITNVGGPGSATVEGTTNEPGTIKVNGSPSAVAKLGPSGPWRFRKEVNLSAGSNSISVEATDANNNVKTNNYTVTVSAGPDQQCAYDANGNMIEQLDGGGTVTQKFEWDAENQLLAMQSASSPAAGVKRTEFSYDGFGRRVRQVEKLHNGASWAVLSQWNYIWNGLELAQKRDSTSATVLVTYFTSGEKAGADALVYLSDHLGSVRRWYRVSDGVVGGADFSAYGERTLSFSGPGEAERGYTGHLTHSSSGLLIAPYRAYDPKYARWLSEDPIGETGGINLYQYVSNSPARYVDDSGLLVAAPVVAAEGVIIIGIGVLILIPLLRELQKHAPSFPSPRFYPSESEQKEEEPCPPAERNPAEDRLLDDKEAKREAKRHGFKGPHELKDSVGGVPNGHFDIYKGRDGNLYVKPKGGIGPGERVYPN
ncbi:RHS repeat-associated core domain-containing protein [Verrucomicrobium spinosum]|uniref:RHS repeat-associated core domain-containing protein n=1 Tax=Verrucomicrobium spinosum TaxID=2736 RepID=UPI00094630C3|nr:RHS repeat-associated core domain-containing protein [Verrucomicrobium spinosum]